MENNEQIMICECSSVEHQIVFNKFKDDDFVYCMIHLKKLSFFKRLIHGIKYVFGYKCRYGDFEEFMLGKKNINKLKEIVNLIENGTE